MNLCVLFIGVLLISGEDAYSDFYMSNLKIFFHFEVISSFSSSDDTLSTRKI